MRLTNRKLQVKIKSLLLRIAICNGTKFKLSQKKSFVYHRVAIKFLNISFWFVQFSSNWHLISTYVAVLFFNYFRLVQLTSIWYLCTIFNNMQLANGVTLRIPSKNGGQISIGLMFYFQKEEFFSEGSWTE